MERAPNDAPFLKLPGELRNPIYALTPKDDLASLSITCFQLYNEVRTLYFEHCVHIIRPVLTIVEPGINGNDIATDNYQAALERLARKPPVVEGCLRKVTLVIVWPWWHKHATKMIGKLLYLVDCIKTVQDFKVIFDTGRDDLLYPGENRSPNPIWHLPQRSWNPARKWLREIVGLSSSEDRQKRGIIPCKTLVLRCGEGGLFWGTNDMCDWASLCETLAEAMRDGSPLENLEVWLPYPTLHQEVWSAQITDLQYAASTWNSYYLGPCGWGEPYWILCLTRIRGLKSIKLKLYEPDELMLGQSEEAEPWVIDELQKLLEGSVLLPASTVPQDPLLNFKFNRNFHMI